MLQPSFALHSHWGLALRAGESILAQTLRVHTYSTILTHLLTSLHSAIITHERMFARTRQRLLIASTCVGVGVFVE